METDDSKKEKKETKSQTNAADKKEEGTESFQSHLISAGSRYYSNATTTNLSSRNLSYATTTKYGATRNLSNAATTSRKPSNGQPFLVKDNKDSMPKQEPPQTNTIQEKDNQNNDFSRPSPPPEQQPQQNQAESGQVPQPQQIQGPNQTSQPQQYYNPQYIPSFSYAYSGRNYPPPLPYNQGVSHFNTTTVIHFGSYCTIHIRVFTLDLFVLKSKTLAASIMMGIMSSYDINTVLIAVGICASVCFAVTIFSFYTKFDFTSCGGILCILLLILVLFGIIAIFVRERAMTLIYAGLGSLVFMMYLAYDTQMLMGGKDDRNKSGRAYICGHTSLHRRHLHIHVSLNDGGRSSKQLTVGSNCFKTNELLNE
ncbi:protein lifeguard 1 [Caerostris extrusa]|uniref:Protein lifeguard 1 n=1 Tax=Caerostris extrusa TaxID=172846 RepID=A0AAV4TGY0_CAEEX|nr:protein lifeguard 1 [Caerostris extrusa]